MAPRKQVKYAEETIDQLKAERDLLADMVSGHEARLQTFATDLRLVLDHSTLHGMDEGQQSELHKARLRLLALIEPVLTGYAAASQLAHGRAGASQLLRRR